MQEPAGDVEGCGVFHGGPRHDPSPAAHNESHFAFLDRVSSPFWARVRSLVDEWLGRLPEHAQAGVRGQLQSGDNRAFKSAFWELYVHESLVRLGFDVEVHPELSHTDARPDFLATGERGSLVVEAAYVASSDEDVAASRRRDDLYEALDQLGSPNFFLWIELDKEGPASPPAAGLRTRLEEWLGELDPDRVSLPGAPGRLEDLPILAWEEQGWEITFRAIPKSPQARGKPGIRPLGVFGTGEASLVDDQTPLRRKLAKKSRKYAPLDQPFLVAIWHGALSSDDWAVENVLIGQEVVQVSRDQSQEARLVRRPNGFFGGPAAARRENVSGVLLINRLDPASVATSAPGLWLNPRAAHPLPASTLPWRTTSFDPMTGQKSEQPASTSPADLFGLPDDWPGPDPPFPNCE